MHIHGIQYYIKFDVTVVDLEGGGGGGSRLKPPSPFHQNILLKKS